MEVKQKMQLANYVNVVVRDIETKEIISEQFKKNIILHQGMRKWLNGYANFFTL